jgi:hypothetical protein
MEDRITLLPGPVSSEKRPPIFLPGGRFSFAGVD